MTTPTETPPTDPIRDALRAMQEHFAGEDDPVFADMCDLVNRAAEEHARRSVAYDQLKRDYERVAEWDGNETDEDDEDDSGPSPQPAALTDEPPLTEEELRVAEERCERATPGPWDTSPGADYVVWIKHREPNGGRFKVACVQSFDRIQENAAFIAAARTDLPRALREIRRLRRIEALVGGLEQANREAHQGLAKRKAEIERLRATVDEQAHRLTTAAKHLGCEPDVIVSCAETRMAEIERLESSELDLIRTAGEIAVRREAEIERLTRAFDGANKLYQAAQRVCDDYVRGEEGETPAIRDLRAALDPAEIEACAKEATRRDGLEALLATANETGAMLARQSDVQKAEIERLARELAAVRTSYQARETAWRAGHVVLDPSEQTDVQPCLDSHCEHPAHVSPGQALTRSEAHSKLLALGMSPAEATDYLDRADAWLAYPAAVPLSVRPILAAYQRSKGPTHTITLAEQAEIIASAPGQIGPGQTPIGRPLPAAASLEARAKRLQDAYAEGVSGAPRVFDGGKTADDAGWLAVARAADASRPAFALDREALGRIVREVWIEWAREQSAPKPSWLVPWEGLSEPDREVDRRIGERIAREALASRPAPGLAWSTAVQIAMALAPDGDVTEQARAVQRIAGRQGLTEEEARAWAEQIGNALEAHGLDISHIAAALLRASRGETCSADPAREDASDGLTHRRMPDLTIACNNQRPNEGATDNSDRVTCPDCVVAQAQIAEEKKP